MRRASVVLAIAAGTCALGAMGCAVGPNYERPKVASPENFRSAPPQKDQASLADLPWWQVFPDPTLQSLVAESLQKAYDVRIGMARVEAFRTAFNASTWALFPTLGANIGAGYSHGFPGTPTFFTSGVGANDVTGSFVGSVGGSWEVDIWGRLRRQRQASEAQWHASEDDLRGVYVALVGDVGTGYFRLRALDLQREQVLDAIGKRKETLTFFQTRLAGGVSNDLEVARAESNVRDAEASLATIERAIVETENLLSVLIARPPAPIARGAAIDAIAAPPQVPAGLPSTLLERRPDVRASEQALIAATAQVGVKMAEFFPRFDLTGFMGFVSNDLTKFGVTGFTDSIYGGSGIFSWTAPVLGGQRIAAQYEIARRQVEISKAAYEKTVMNALREVADALVGIQKLGETRTARDAQVLALIRAESTARTRYQGGVATYLDLLTAQEQLLVAQIALAQVKGDQLAAVVRLYRALGGGWSTGPVEKKQDAKGSAPAKKG